MTVKSFYLVLSKGGCAGRERRENCISQKVLLCYYITSAALGCPPPTVTVCEVRQIVLMYTVEPGHRFCLFCRQIWNLFCSRQMGNLTTLAKLWLCEPSASTAG